MADIIMVDRLRDVQWDFYISILEWVSATF